ncbi:MAG TPA: cell wall-binding repeat-containing protein, partial [Actinoplanes sp.]|nr:cell wall-binding repeat-containing protein [Actinoplanes sp.]
GVAAALAGYATSTMVQRHAGADRYATAAAISAANYAPGVAVAYVATGANFPDALAGAAVAGNLGGPLLLVTRDTIPAATAAELARLAPKRIVILGSTGVVSANVGLALGTYETD